MILNPASLSHPNVGAGIPWAASAGATWVWAISTPVHHSTFRSLQLAGEAHRDLEGWRKIHLLPLSVRGCLCVPSWNLKLHNHFRSMVLFAALFSSGTNLSPPTYFFVTMPKLEFTLRYCQKKMKARSVDYFFWTTVFRLIESSLFLLTCFLEDWRGFGWTAVFAFGLICEIKIWWSTKASIFVTPVLTGVAVFQGWCVHLNKVH